MMQEVEHAGGGLPSGDVTIGFTDIEGSTGLRILFHTCNMYCEVV
jgi:hypothetical protein